MSKFLTTALVGTLLFILFLVGCGSGEEYPLFPVASSMQRNVTATTYQDDVSTMSITSIQLLDAVYAEYTELVLESYDGWQLAIEFLSQFYTLRMGGWLPHVAETHWAGGSPGEFIYDRVTENWEWYRIRTHEVPTYFRRGWNYIYNRYNERVTDAIWMTESGLYASAFSIWDFGNNGAHDILVTYLGGFEGCGGWASAKLFRWIDGQYQTIPIQTYYSITEDWTFEFWPDEGVLVTEMWHNSWGFYVSDDGTLVMYIYCNTFGLGGPRVPIYASLIFDDGIARLEPLVDTLHDISSYCWYPQHIFSWYNRLTGETHNAPAFPMNGAEHWHYNDEWGTIYHNRERYIQGTNILITPVERQTELEEYIRNLPPISPMPTNYTIDRQ